VDEPWDQDKARANLRKHGVSFGEAVTIDRDPWKWTVPDVEHSDTEPRLRMTGISARGRLITLVFVYRNGMIRPITAWRATQRETDDYNFRHR
jgi:uncharacterized DUF497 family protein